MCACAVSRVRARVVKAMFEDAVNRSCRVISVYHVMSVYHVSAAQEWRNRTVAEHACSKMQILARGSDAQRAAAATCHQGRFTFRGFIYQNA